MPGTVICALRGLRPLRCLLDTEVPRPERPLPKSSAASAWPLWTPFLHPCQLLGKSLVPTRLYESRFFLFAGTSQRPPAPSFGPSWAAQQAAQRSPSPSPIWTAMPAASRRCLVVRLQPARPSQPAAPATQTTPNDPSGPVTAPLRISRQASRRLTCRHWDWYLGQYIQGTIQHPPLPSPPLPSLTPALFPSHPSPLAHTMNTMPG